MTATPLGVERAGLWGMERWRAIPGYAGLYEVSDHGRVRSLDRIDGQGRRWPGRVLKPGLTSVGYPSVALHNCGQRTHLIHRLVLRAFVGEPPESRPDGCHSDGNPTNNTLGNLRWDSHQGNMADKHSHGTHVAGSRHGCAKLSDSDVLAIRASAESLRVLADRYGVSRASVSMIRNRRTWRHLP